MARKPAQTTTTRKAPAATDATEDKTAAAAGDDQGAVDTGSDQAATDPGVPNPGAADTTDTKGGDTAGIAAEAPAQTRGADDPGQTGGEERSVLPAEQPAGEVEVVVHSDQPAVLVEEHRGSRRAMSISDMVAASLSAGEEGKSLAAAIADAAEKGAPIIPKGTEPVFVGLDLAVSEVEWIVTCHREGGRRRADRRWPKGETRVEAGELTAYDLAILKGDPQFSVRPAYQD